LLTYKVSSLAPSFLTDPALTQLYFWTRYRNSLETEDLWARSLKNLTYKIVIEMLWGKRKTGTNGSVNDKIPRMTCRVSGSMCLYHQKVIRHCVMSFHRFHICIFTVSTATCQICMKFVLARYTEICQNKFNFDPCQSSITPTLTVSKLTTIHDLKYTLRSITFVLNISRYVVRM
jgi:hypothetical protein